MPMRAILIAGRGAMRPLIDRPVVQHVVEHLAAWSTRELDIVACTDGPAVRAALGDGRRWGPHHPPPRRRRPDQAVRHGP